MRRIITAVALAALSVLTVVASPAGADTSDGFETVWIGPGPGANGLLVRAEKSFVIEVDATTQSSVEVGLNGARDILHEEITMGFIRLRNELIEIPNVSYVLDVPIQVQADNGQSTFYTVGRSLHFEVGSGESPGDQFLAKWEALDLVGEISDHVPSDSDSDSGSDPNPNPNPNPNPGPNPGPGAGGPGGHTHTGDCSPYHNDWQ